MLLKGRSQYPWRTPRGSLLITALWMITILTLFSVSISYHVRQKITLAERIDRRNELCGIAERGVYQALYRIRQKKEADEGSLGLNDTYISGEMAFSHIRVGGGVFTVSYPYPDAKSGKTKIHYGVEDEEAKININKLDGVTLTRFFQTIGGIEREVAEEISYSIIDWRDTDDSLSHPEYGFEDDDYEDFELPYESKDSPFESIEELLLVRGVTPEIYELLKPFVTIYGIGVVNINTAPREVLKGLGMSESLVENIVAYRAGPDQEEGTSDDQMFSQIANISVDLIRRVKISQNDVNFLNQIISQGQIGINSHNFRIRSRAEILPQQQKLEIEAVADIDGKILSWSVGVPGKMSPADWRRWLENHRTCDQR